VAKRRPSGDGALFQRKDGMWVGSCEIVSFDGKRRQKRVYAAKYSVCKKKLKELRESIDDGFVPSASTNVTTWLQHWLEEIKRPSVRPKTFEYYEESVRLHLLPALGTRRVGQLTPEDVRQALKTITTSSNKKRAHLVLNLALKDGVKNGVVRRNICEAVDRPGHTAVKRNAFTYEQSQLIIRTATAIEASRDQTKGEPAIATRWATAFFTGARQSELLGLEWSRVNFDEGGIDLSWQLQQLKKVHKCGAKVDGKYPCGRVRPSYCPQADWDFADGFEKRDCYKSLLWTRPKTAAGTRWNPLPKELMDRFARHAEIDEPNPFGLVWHNVDGRPLSPTDDHHAWQALLLTAGVTKKGSTIPMHSMRHSTATLMEERGVAPEDRMDLMGQSSAAAQEGYLHRDPSRKRAAVETLVGLLD
jgi:integrase